MEIGRLVVKTAGRDAGRVGVVVEHLDGNFVLIDGNVRRKKCNTLHLEPLDEVIKIKSGASHSDVVSEFKKLKLETWSTKPRQKTEKKLRQRKASNPNKKPAKVASEKPKVKEAKKEVKPKKAEKKEAKK